MALSYKRRLWPLLDSVLSFCFLCLRVAFVAFHRIARGFSSSQVLLIVPLLRLHGGPVSEALGVEERYSGLRHGKVLILSNR